MTILLKQFLCQLAQVAYKDNGLLDRNRLTGFSSLGHGGTRIVYKVEFEGKTYAVKFAHSNRDRVNNRREHSAWRNFRDTTKKYLAEVFDVSTCGRVLAMELVETLSSSGRWNEGDQWNQNLRRQLETVEAMTRRQVSYITCDNHSGNLGIRANGDIVWIDYGLKV